MSRAGLGSGTVGEVNVAFTGDAAPIVDASKKADASISGIGKSVGKDLSPITSILSSMTRFIGIGTAVYSAISLISAAWNYSANEALRAKKVYQETFDAGISAFSKFDFQNKDEGALSKRNRLLAEANDLYKKQRQAALDIKETMSDNRRAERRAAIAAANEGLERAERNIELQFARDKKEDEAKSLVAETRARIKGEYDVSKARVANLDGYTGAYYSSLIEEQHAYETLQGTELDAALEVISIQLNSKLQSLDAEAAAAKKYNEEIHRQKMLQIDAEKRARLDAFREIAEQQSTNLSGITFDPRVGDALELRARQADKTLRIIGGV